MCWCDPLWRLLHFLAHFHDLSISCVWAPVVVFLFPDTFGCDAIEAFDVVYEVIFKKINNNFIWVN